MDLYLEGPGVGIAGATQRGTLNVQGQIAARTLPGGEYELWLTGSRQSRERLAGVGDDHAQHPGPPRRSSSSLKPARATTRTQRVDDPRRGLRSFTIATSTAELRVINAATEHRAARRRHQWGVLSAVVFGRRRLRSPPPYAPVCGSATPNAQCHARRQPRRAQARNANRANPRATNNRDVHGTGGCAAVCGHRRRRSTYSGRGETELHERGDAIPRRRLRAHTDGGPDPANIPAVTVLGVPGSQFAYSFFPPGTYDLYLRETTTRRDCSRDRRAVTVDGRRHLRRARDQWPGHGDRHRHAVRRLPLRPVRVGTGPPRDLLFFAPLPCMCPGSSVDRAFAS